MKTGYQFVSARESKQSLFRLPRSQSSLVMTIARRIRRNQTHSASLQGRLRTLPLLMLSQETGAKEVHQTSRGMCGCKMDG
jgi:hypothetical protein